MTAAQENEISVKTSRMKSLKRLECQEPEKLTMGSLGWTERDILTKKSGVRCLEEWAEPLTIRSSLTMRKLQILGCGKTCSVLSAKPDRVVRNSASLPVGSPE
jgi:hypothetical protein